MKKMIVRFVLVSSLVFTTGQALASIENQIIEVITEASLK